MATSLTLQTDPVIVWKPLPGSQTLALDSRANDTLYHGTRGPGKTDAQLMRFRRNVGRGYGMFWRGVIFDREYKNLDDLVSKSKRWFRRFNDGAEWMSSTSAYKWVWPTGEELLFRVAKKIDDYENYHGQEFPFIGWNELTKYPTAELYDMMMSCNRSSFTPDKDTPAEMKKRGELLPPIPLETFATCNSKGPGRTWVKTRFIDVAPYGQIVKREFDVFDPQTQMQRIVYRTQVAIFGSYKENIYLDPIYIATLTSDPDENRRKSWLEGDWNVISGGAFDDLWKPKIHILPRFKIPKDWYVDRTFDWGSSQPFSVGWWAEANGEEVELPLCKHCGKSNLSHLIEGINDHVFDAKVWCPQPGSLIRIEEWYGTKEIGSNKGVKMSGGDIALGIIEREVALMARGWIVQQPFPGPADNSIRDVREADVDTIEKKMADKGVRWQDSDKSPGSRRNGLQLIRDRLEASIRNEGAGLFFMENCRAAISTIPVLPRDEDHEDDVDSSAEDHPYDETRYRVLKGNNRYAKSIKVTYPH